MQKQIEVVKKFHETYNVPFKEQPSLVDKDISLLRYELMHEENEEYYKATLEGNLIEVADACGDMLYILLGTIISHGLQYKIEEVFDEIQRSNMSKLGEDGKPIYREDGKVLKGPNYSKPDIVNVLANPVKPKMPLLTDYELSFLPSVIHIVNNNLNIFDGIHPDNKKVLLNILTKLGNHQR